MSRPLPLMVFAAGFGTRMGALTATCPKPLIKVGGVTLLDRALDVGRAVGAAPMVVNTHYLAEQIYVHVGARADVALSPEPAQILETGGGLRQALPLLGAGAVMTLNPDVVWTGGNPLAALQAAWDPARMDALLLVKARAGLAGRKGASDFVMGETGQIARADGREGVVYLGAQILKPEGLAQIPETAFSLNRLWDEMIAAGRVYGLLWAGGWCDVGSPEGLAEAEAMLEAAHDVS